MNGSKTHFYLLGAVVVGLGIVLGTALLLKIGPQSRIALVDRRGDDRLKPYGAAPDFKLAEQSGMIPHSPRFVLIDKQARIRGYYDSRELEAFVRLKNDIDTLLKG